MSELACYGSSNWRSSGWKNGYSNVFLLYDVASVLVVVVGTDC